MAHFHVLTNLYPPEALGGYELLAFDVVERLRQRGHRVTVITTGEMHRDDVEVRRILRLSRPFGQTPGRDRLRHAAVAAYNRLILGLYLKTNAKPDAVLVMSQRRLGLEGLRAYREAGIPCVYTVNDDWPIAYQPARESGSVKARLLGALDQGPWARHTWRGIDVRRVVYLSRSIRTLVRRTGVPFPPGHVCPQGIDLGAFPRREFRVIPDRPRLLFVGRLHPTKAPDVAIQALVALRARGIDAHLTLAGGAVSAAFEAELNKQVADAGAVGDVTFLGHVPRRDLSRIYQKADIFLFPLRWEDEAQGLTYMEAMASGVPVVAFPTSGALEVLRPKRSERDKKLGWTPEESLGGSDVVVLSERCDGDAFAEACLALMASPELQRELQSRARAWLAEYASLDRYVSVLEAELLDGARSSDVVVLDGAAAEETLSEVAPISGVAPAAYEPGVSPPPLKSGISRAPLANDDALGPAVQGAVDDQ